MAMTAITAMRSHFSEMELSTLTFPWLRLAVLPTGFSPLSSHTLWTVELSGLATGRAVQEYLPGGHDEAIALDALLMTVSVDLAARLFTECLTTALQSDAEPDTTLSRAGPTVWARVAALAARVALDPDGRGLAAGTLAATLSSPAVKRDAHGAAVVICLARRVLALRAEGEGIDERAEAYEQWLREVVLGTPVVLDTIIPALTELLPVDSLRFLRVSHRVFTVRNPTFRPAAEYIALVRTRVYDLDPLPGHENGEREMKDVTNDTPDKKALLDVVRIVKEFAKMRREAPAKKKVEIPSLLKRQMNFHRYHFRKYIAGVLLSADVPSMCDKVSDVALGMMVDEFENNRMELIRAIAFRRKDHAIAPTEANNALKDIKEALRSRAERAAPRALQSLDGKKAEASRLSKDSSIGELLFSLLLHEAGKALSDKDAKPIAADDPPGKGILLRKLRTMAESATTPTEQAQLAADILQEISSAVQKAEADGIGVQLSRLTFDSRDERLKTCTTWWSQTGRVLIWFMTNVLADDRVAVVQRPMLYQLFYLSAARHGALSESGLLTLTSILVVLVVVQSNPALTDLCFTPVAPKALRLRHISALVTWTMPLTTPARISATATLALYAVPLLHAADCCQLSAADFSLTLADARDAKRPDFGTSNEELSSALTDILRWIVCNPWRLSESTETVDHGEPETLVDFTGLLENIIGFILSEGLNELKSVNIERLLDLEARCGWGKKEAILTLLRQLACSGISPEKLINSAVSFVSEATEGQRSKPAWILEAIVLFSDENTGCVEDKSSNESPAAAVEAVTKKFRAQTALQMLDIFAAMDRCYFCGLDNVDDHITRVLVRKLWPLPRRVVGYIIRCLGRCNGENILANPFLVANAAMDVSSERGGESKTNSEDLNIQISMTSSALEIILNKDITNIFDGNGHMNSAPTTLTGREHSLQLGIALSLFLVTKVVASNVISVLGSALTSLNSLEPRQAGDIIDVAMLTSALLPLTHRYLNQGDQSRLVTLTRSMLGTFMKERLSDVSLSTAPLWTSHSLNDHTRSSHDAGEFLRLWSENGDESDQQMVALCIGRVISGLVDLPSSLLSSLLDTIGQERCLQKLLPNLIHGYEACTTLSEPIKSTLKTDIVRVIETIAFWLQAIVEGDFLNGVLVSFPKVSGEILAVLSSNGFS